MRVTSQEWWWPQDKGDRDSSYNNQHCNELKRSRGYKYWETGWWGLVNIVVAVVVVVISGLGRFLLVVGQVLAHVGWNLINHKEQSLCGDLMMVGLIGLITGWARRVRKHKLWFKNKSQSKWQRWRYIVEIYVIKRINMHLKWKLELISQPWDEETKRCGFWNLVSANRWQKDAISHNSTRAWPAPK